MNFKLPVKLYILYTKGLLFFMVISVFFLFFDLFVLFRPLKSVPVALDLHYKTAVITHNVS